MKIYFEDQAQWPMGNDHSFCYALIVLSKIKVLLQTLQGTRPITLYNERTVAHTHMSV